MPKAKGPSKKQLAVYASRSPGQVIEKRSKKGQLMYYVVQPNKRLLRIPAPPTSRGDIAEARRLLPTLYKTKKGMNRDLSMTSKKLTKNVNTWKKNPGRYDMEGVDTKGSIRPAMPRVKRKATASGSNKRRRVN